MKKPSFGMEIGVKGLCLTLILSSTMLPAFASRARNSVAKAIAPGAIGIIQSEGVLSINGRAANGSFTLWGDELVQATTSARIIFGALGEVNISPGASLQLKMENARLHEAAGSQAFSAKLLAGAMNVKLRGDSGALVNSVESEFTASKGAEFKVDLQAGRAMVQTNNGTILAHAFAPVAKPLESKTTTSTTTKKDAQHMATKKLEKLIGNFKLNVPTAVVAEAARRETALDDLAQRRNAFMRSISLSSSNAFFADRKSHTLKSLARSIGAAESLHGLLVNGRLTSGREMLWGGEVLEAPRGSGARLAFPTIGQVVLNSGAKAKVTTESVGLVTAGQSTQRVLAAQLLSGDVQVRFDSNASGYVRAGDAVLAATRGASFRVEMREGNGAVDVTNGSVMVIGNWPLLAPPLTLDEASGKARLTTDNYQIRPANLAGAFTIGVNGSHSIQMRVTDAKNQPLADVPVKFTLHGAGALGMTKFGLNSVEVKTNAHGIAVIPYHAPAQAGSARVTAEVPGTDATTTTTANVTTQRDSFWQGPWPAVITFAGAVGAGVAVYATRKDRFTIRGKGDLVIVP